MRNLETTVSKQDGPSCRSRLTVAGVGLFAVCLVMAGSLAFGGQTMAPEQPPFLTKLSQVATMALEDGRQGLTAKVRGTVTFCDRERGMLFVQEGTDAVAIRIPVVRENDDSDPQPGQLVEVEGVTMAGRTKCSIRSKSMRLIGPGQMPATFDLNGRASFTERAENRWARVRGWIPGVSNVGNRLNFGLVFQPGQSVEV